MTSLTLGLFLVAHGLVHVAIYATPSDPSKGASFDPARSWALAARGTDVAVMRSASAALSFAVAAAYAASGWMLLMGSDLWAPPALVGASTGLALKGLWFHPWLSIGIAIDLAVLWAAAVGWPA